MTSPLETQLVNIIQAARLPFPVREHRFSLDTMHRFDFCWPEIMLAVEVEGGTWSGGRHTRGKGYEEDITKYNLCALEGWTLIRVTGAMIRDGRALQWLLKAFERLMPNIDDVAA